MKKAALNTAVISLLAAVLVAASASAQAWRGMGRIQGVVTDQNGHPIKGAKVLLVSLRSGDNSGPPAFVTDAKGKFAAGGLIGGEWNVDIEAEGFLPRKLSANVSEVNFQPPMKIMLEPKPEEKPAPQEQERQAIVVGGVEISPEIAKALEDVNSAMKEEKWADAASNYEKALAVLSTNTSLKFALARAYYGMGNLKKAIATLQEVYDADTGNVMAATLLGDMLLQDSQTDAAKKVLEAIPAGAISDPNTVLNLGIRYMNLNLPADAYKYFNDAVTTTPDLPAAYYYRGIAEVQLKKLKEAKADFQKVIALAPDGDEAKDDKEMLAQMK